MSDHQMPQTTPKDFIAATLGGLVAPGLTIFMIVMLFLGIQKNMGQADPAPVADQVVRERIQPFGQSLAVDPNVPKIELSGEQVYNEICSGCHASGALGSPKFKEKADWAKRNAQGYETLLIHALKGFNKMPARGGDPELSDMEVAHGIVYMTNAAGANFQAVLKKEVEPSAAELAQGKTVYMANCASCHDTGITGAQKLTDAKAWTPLIKEGKDFLYNAAINGSFGGPAKGGNLKLSDADTKLAVDYMVAEAKSAITKSVKVPPKAAASK
jgi:cytochrome c5